MSLQDLEQKIADLESDVERAQHKFLERAGWKHTCSHPGAMWLWEKEQNGKTYVVDLKSALYMERNR